MTTFVVAPYRPEEHESMAPEVMRTTSDLKINPFEYQSLLLERWPGINVYHLPRYVLLEWVFPVTEGWSGPIGGLENDQQTVFIDTPFEEFFLWHRSVIPGKYRLFLSHEGSWDTLELKVDTTLEEIQSFVGGLS